MKPGPWRIVLVAVAAAVVDTAAVVAAAVDTVAAVVVAAAVDTAAAAVDMVVAAAVVDTVTAATTVVDVRTTAKSHQSLQRDSFKQKTRKETSGFFLDQGNGTKEFKASGIAIFFFFAEGASSLLGVVAGYRTGLGMIF
jgi:hypothetical protein